MHFAGTAQASGAFIHAHNPVYVKRACNESMRITSVSPLRLFLLLKEQTIANWSISSPLSLPGTVH
ncbi:hypothetical protein NECAME_07098 [Necator americanus]|uniref:Uncharacterized protein n=1 Tax=Necator americanus TaxID=51031 RepID=W2TSJ4_NECAM|nr:hypothetical protein NECAME_07098 [Necator americanus]ETN84002.1 hypothetical protein NECAME_07098 [Necator americanus]